MRYHLFKFLGIGSGFVQIFDVRKSINIFQLTGFVEINATEQFAAKYELSLLNMKKVSGGIAQSETAPAQNIGRVLDVEMRKRKKGNFISILAIMGSPLLQKATEQQVRQIFRVSTAVHAYAGGEICVPECFFLGYSWKNVVAHLFERRCDFANPYDEGEGFSKEGTSKVCSDHDRNFASLLRNRAGE